MRIENCCRVESPTEQLLNRGSMVTGLSTPTECEVDEMDSVRVNDGEGLGATLGVRAWVSRVVTKLEDVAGFPERGFFEVCPVPLLYVPTR